MTAPQEIEAEERDQQAIRALVKRTLADPPVAAPNLLPGVQRRLRRHDRGKLFARGWSSTQTRVSYALLGLFTLLIAFLAYLVLVPSGIR